MGGRSGGFAELCATQGAKLVRHKAVLSERGEPALAGRASVPKSAPMPKAGNPRCQGPTAPKIGCLVFNQTGRAKLQPVCLRPRYAASPPFRAARASAAGQGDRARRPNPQCLPEVPGYAQRAGGGRVRAASGQVVPTSSRPRPRETRRSSGAERHWHGRGDATSLTGARLEPVRHPRASGALPRCHICARG